MSEELNRNFQIGAEIGRGRFGVVRRCTLPETGDEFAVKSIDKRLLADDLDRACAEREAKAHAAAALGNPGVAQIRAVYEDEDSLHLVIELCEGGDLWDSVIARGPAAEPEAAGVIAAIARTLASCHRRGVAHRDVKPENVLLDSWGRLRLADFGSAEFFLVGGGRVAMRGLVGTPCYVAPEVLAGREYGEKVDVWSLGVVMYIMISGGVPPFYGKTAEETFAAVARANLRFPSRIFGSVSPAAKELMRRMISKDVTRRFSMEQVLRHPWIANGGEVGAVAEQSGSSKTL